MSITTNCQVLEVGKVRRDAGALFGEQPFTDWNDKCLAEKSDVVKTAEMLTISRYKRVTLPANVLAIWTDSEHILVDTGPPAVHESDADEGWSHSRLRPMLRTVNMQIKDITKVVLTSFDIDHAGGLTHMDRAGNLVYSFRHAEVFFNGSNRQRQRPRSIPSASQATEMLLQNNHHPCLEVTEIAPGITMHPIAGPSLQGCVLQINRGADRILYLGDLCPTLHHINPSIIPAFDDNPEATYTERKHWLNLAISGGYKVIFGHGAKFKSGWIEDTKEGLVVRPA